MFKVQQGVSKISRTSCLWLSIRHFANGAEVVAALKELHLTEQELWTYDFHTARREGQVITKRRRNEQSVEELSLSKHYNQVLQVLPPFCPLAKDNSKTTPTPQNTTQTQTCECPSGAVKLPTHLALAIGPHSRQISQDLKLAASKHLFLPLAGVTGPCAGLSVASALLLQALFLSTELASIARNHYHTSPSASSNSPTSPNSPASSSAAFSSSLSDSNKCTTALTKLFAQTHRPEQGSASAQATLYSLNGKNNWNQKLDCELVGCMSGEERQTHRADWFTRLGKNPKQISLFQPLILNPPPPLADLRTPEAMRNLWQHPKIRKKQGLIDQTRENASISHVNLVDQKNETTQEEGQEIKEKESEADLSKLETKLTEYTLDDDEDVKTSDSQINATRLHYVPGPNYLNHPPIDHPSSPTAPASSAPITNPTPIPNSSDAPIVSPGSGRVHDTVQRVLNKRNNQLILVVEKCYNPHNMQNILQIADVFGLQHVWIVEPAMKVSPNADRQLSSPLPSVAETSQWLTVRRFNSSTDCINELRRQNRQIWVTELGKDAVKLTVDNLCQIPIPRRTAVVMGRETDGASPQMIAAADLRIYLPMYGFGESFNIAVATALVLQRMFFKSYANSMLEYNHLRTLDETQAQKRSITGNMSRKERQELEALWLTRME